MSSQNIHVQSVALPVASSDANSFTSTVTTPVASSVANPSVRTQNPQGAQNFYQNN